METKKQKDIKYLREVLRFVTPNEKVNFIIEVNNYINYCKKGELLKMTENWIEDKEMEINIDLSVIIIQNLFLSEMIFSTREQRRNKL